MGDRIGGVLKEAGGRGGGVRWGGGGWGGDMGGEGGARGPLRLLGFNWRALAGDVMYFMLSLMTTRLSDGVAPTRCSSQRVALLHSGVMMDDLQAMASVRSFDGGVAAHSRALRSMPSACRRLLPYHLSAPPVLAADGTLPAYMTRQSTLACATSRNP